MSTRERNSAGQPWLPGRAAQRRTIGRTTALSVAFSAICLSGCGYRPLLGAASPQRRVAKIIVELGPGISPRLAGWLRQALVTKLVSQRLWQSRGGLLRIQLHDLEQREISIAERTAVSADLELRYSARLSRGNEETLWHSGLRVLRYSVPYSSSAHHTERGREQRLNDLVERLALQLVDALAEPSAD
ncbi:MAG: hypothetical protein H6707_19690 [Deltaproteobacteria bacterium]|nr:hypothetical protein [Deltaproteobacteria bacterium]